MKKSDLKKLIQEAVQKVSDDESYKLASAINVIATYIAAHPDKNKQIMSLLSRRISLEVKKRNG